MYNAADGAEKETDLPKVMYEVCGRAKSWTQLYWNPG